MDSVWIGIQLIGFVAFAMDTAGCHLKKGRNILMLSVPSLLLWGAHFFLLGALTGVLMCLASATRTTLCLVCPPSARRYIFAAGLCAVVVLTVISWQGPLSIFPFLGSVAYCFSALYPNCTRSVRMSWAVCMFFWLIYGVAVGSVPQVVAALAGLTSVGWALWKDRNPSMKLAPQVAETV